MRGAFAETSSEEDRTHGVNKECSSRSRGAGCPVKQACRYLTSQHTRLFLLHLLKISHIRSTYSRAVRSLPPSHSLRVFDKRARLAASHVSPSVLVCLFGWKKIASDGRSLGRSVGWLSSCAVGRGAPARRLSSRRREMSDGCRGSGGRGGGETAGGPSVRPLAVAEFMPRGTRGALFPAES